jgi:CheY-like chemotaxis protein
MAARSILVVDDDADTCETLRDILADSGYDADEAHGGREALELAERGDYRLALLDYRMPDMSGTELFERLKTRYRGIEGVLITAHAGPDVAEEAIRPGIRCLIPKPLDLAALLPLVGEVVGEPS